MDKGAFEVLNYGMLGPGVLLSSYRVQRRNVVRRCDEGTSVCFAGVLCIIVCVCVCVCVCRCLAMLM